jgi:hypothetical protein
MGRNKNPQVVQDDVWVQWVKGCAWGIRLALGYEDIAFRQRKKL